MPEREPHPGVFAATFALFETLIDSPFWAEAYIRWELGVLEALGFGLDLRQCAVTGTNDNLTYVSPRSGRAVSEDGTGPWRERLLPLPQFLIGHGLSDHDQILMGLRLTGYFLEKHVFFPQGDQQPAARDLLIQRLSTQFFS
ncbi:DNA repair protein RecO (recombination protein O) [Azospirillaceae bacterium]